MFCVGTRGSVWTWRVKPNRTMALFASNSHIRKLSSFDHRDDYPLGNPVTRRRVSAPRPEFAFMYLVGHFHTNCITSAKLSGLGGEGMLGRRNRRRGLPG